VKNRPGRNPWAIFKRRPDLIKSLIALFLLLLAPAAALAEGNLRIYNSRTASDALTYEIEDYRVGPHIVPSLNGSVTIPPRTTQTNWVHYHDLFLCTNGTQHAVVVRSLSTPLASPTGPDVPSGGVCQLVSSWGTQPRSTALMTGEQRDKRMTFKGDYDFDAEMGASKNGTGVWYERGNYGGWPYGGRTRAVWIRAECGRASSPGQCQVNFTSLCSHEQALGNEPWYAMRFQTSGYSTVGNREQREDIRILREPTAPDAFCIGANTHSIFVYLNDGYEMK
jgi:hypothetical protein